MPGMYSSSRCTLKMHRIKFRLEACLTFDIHIRHLEAHVGPVIFILVGNVTKEMIKDVL